MQLRNWHSDCKCYTEMRSNKVAVTKGFCGKFLVLGLLSVVCFLLLVLREEQKTKETMIKDKNVLHDTLEASIKREKEAGAILTEKTSLELGKQANQIQAQKKESGELQRKLDKKDGELETLRKNTVSRMKLNDI